jgi:hypothetical protein
MTGLPRPGSLLKEIRQSNPEVVPSSRIGSFKKQFNGFLIMLVLDFSQNATLLFAKLKNKYLSLF